MGSAGCTKTPANRNRWCTLQLLDGSFPPQIRIFHPQKKPLCPRSCLCHPNCLPSSSQRAQKCCFQLQKQPDVPGPVLADPLEFSDMALLGMIVFSRMGSSGLWRGGQQHQREGRDLVCVCLLKSILPRMNHRGCSSLIFDAVDLNLSRYIRDREVPVLGI